MHHHTEIFFTLTDQQFVILYIISRNNDMTNTILLFLVKPFITDVLHTSTEIILKDKCIYCIASQRYKGVV